MQKMVQKLLQISVPGRIWRQMTCDESSGVQVVKIGCGAGMS